jgi:uncharacterized protein YyaL (SSP411 family)
LRGGGIGLLEDVAATGLAALAGFEATGEARYFEVAHRICRRMIALYWDASSGLFFAHPGGGEPVALRGPMPALVQDSPCRSSVALALELLNGMAVYQDDVVLLGCREEALMRAAARWPDFGVLASGVMVQVATALEPPPVAVVVGRRSDPRTLALCGACRRARRVGSRVILLDADAPIRPISRELSGLVARYRAALGPNAYLMWKGTCEPAPEEPERLAARLEAIGRRGED